MRILVGLGATSIAAAVFSSGPACSWQHTKNDAANRDWLVRAGSSGVSTDTTKTRDQREDYLRNEQSGLYSKSQISTSLRTQATQSQHIIKRKEFKLQFTGVTPGTKAGCIGVHKIIKISKCLSTCCWRKTCSGWI